MAQQSNYFRLGVFILSGLAILVASIIVLGAGSLLENTIPAETYFNESVQGLDVGSPVKFRGVQIGSVKSIGFLPSKYPDVRGPEGRYVLVEMKIYEHVAKGISVEEVKDNLHKAIQNGLRVRLTTQGLTGVAYLEINFFDPQQNRPLPIDWTPQDLYIPSAPSTLSRVEKAFNDIATALNQIRGINFKSLANSLDDLFQNLDQTLKEANVTSIGELLVKDLAEVRNILQRVDALLADKAADTILPDLAASAASAKNIMVSSEQNIINTLTDVSHAASTLSSAASRVENLLANPQLDESIDNLPQMLENLGNASQDIRRSTVELNRLLRSLTDLLQDQRGNIESIIGGADSLMNNLNDITDDAKQNPSRLFFGDPPQHIEPEQNQ